jgi:hypothetical protein
MVPVVGCGEQGEAEVEGLHKNWSYPSTRIHHCFSEPRTAVACKHVLSFVYTWRGGLLSKFHSRLLGLIIENCQYLTALTHTK